MRVYYFVLVACTATLTDSANASGTSSPTMTKTELAANVRSAHGGHDGVAVKKPLEVHDPKTGEERMTLMTRNDDTAIMIAIDRLLTALHEYAPVERETLRKEEAWASDYEAIRHHIDTKLVGQKQSLAWLKLATSTAKGNPTKPGGSVEAVREAYRAHLEATELTKAMNEMSRSDVHPLDVLKKMIPAYEGVRNPESPTAAMVFEELKMYIEKYNADRPDTPPVTMVRTLHDGFGDVAKLASFLSNLKLNPTHEQPAERMEQLLSEYLISNEMLDDVALMLGIPTQKQRILAHHNLNFFIRHMSTMMKLLPSEHQKISALLTVMFGEEQAAYVMEKAGKLSSSVSSEAALDEKLKARILENLNSEISVARSLLRQEH